MSADERRSDGTDAGASSPDRDASGEDALRGLDPEALFGGVTFLDERQTLQWLGHLQRLASTGLLAGGMAHDMAGLIQPMLGECERVLLKDDPTEYRQALVRVREWTRRAEEYIKALIDLVKRDESHRASVPVEKVVEDTLLLLESARRLAGVSVKRNLDNFHEALVDRTRLMQAVVNLVTNAARAAREGGGEVEVTVRGWRGWVLVEVEDNGPGVAEEIQERIFQPFVHGGASKNTPSKHGLGAGATGTGLGLYITKRLIEDQGGRIEFETERGSGTTFRLMLEPAPREKRSSESEQGRDRGRRGSQE